MFTRKSWAVPLLWFLKNLKPPMLLILLWLFAICFEWKSLLQYLLNVSITCGSIFGPVPALNSKFLSWLEKFWGLYWPEMQFTLANDNLWSAVLRRIFCCCIPVKIIFSKAMFWNALMDWLLVVGLYTIYITLSVLNEGKFSIVFNNFEFMFKANLSLLAN